MSAGARRSSLSLGRVAGSAVFLHWSFPVGVVLLAGGLRATGPSAIAALLLLLLHAAGHWVTARALGVSVETVDLTALGGALTWRGVAGPLGGPLEAWGGVGALLLVRGVAVLLGVAPDDALGNTLVERTAWLVALNLLPLPGFHGADAWALPWRLGRRLRSGLYASDTFDEPLPPPHAAPPRDDGDEDEAAGPKADEARRIAEKLLQDARRGADGDEP